MHPTDVPVGDSSRVFQLIPESFDRLFGKGQIEPTASAEVGIGGILKETFGAFHGLRLPELRNKNFLFGWAGCGGRGHIFDSIIPSNHRQEA
jgi:hypothetical protein